LGTKNCGTCIKHLSNSQLNALATAAGETMAVGVINSRHTADEEARAEVDVLNSRLEKTAQLTKKIQACLGRLDATGKSVRDVAGPLNGETKKLQILNNSRRLVAAFSSQ
jgi:exocyst complex protein 7